MVRIGVSIVEEASIVRVDAANNYCFYAVYRLADADADRSQGVM